MRPGNRFSVRLTVRLRVVRRSSEESAPRLRLTAPANGAPFAGPPRVGSKLLTTWWAPRSAFRQTDQWLLAKVTNHPRRLLAGRQAVSPISPPARSSHRRLESPTMELSLWAEVGGQIGGERFAGQPT